MEDKYEKSIYYIISFINLLVHLGIYVLIIPLFIVN